LVGLRRQLRSPLLAATFAQKKNKPPTHEGAQMETWEMKAVVVGGRGLENERGSDLDNDGN